jgi:hypothetical protein
VEHVILRVVVIMCLAVEREFGVLFERLFFWMMEHRCLNCYSGPCDNAMTG